MIEATNIHDRDVHIDAEYVMSIEETMSRPTQREAFSQQALVIRMADGTIHNVWDHGRRLVAQIKEAKKNVSHSSA